ncbi:hypothetical protein ITP53_14695 [Nonomuraea sp. K274]|uniref:Uncharacterized protein n=1 Tax=Nonomuraea cypriaca TaxID=1187855 RepID=A0A931F0B3_9ACTN|nr:hypothetical protein [Nonomuraea cypriaca]MBF8186966.1 hypothetical protein [Nonomuraea cypriaca]
MVSREGTTPVTLSRQDELTLAALPVGGPPQTVDLSALDDYRVDAVRGRDGDVLITGLSLHGVEETLNRLQLFELVMFGHTGRPSGGDLRAILARGPGPVPHQWRRHRECRWT